MTLPTVGDIVNDPTQRNFCTYCKHFVVQSWSQGYSDVTPGSPFGMYCEKDHWSLNDSDETTEVREHLGRAKDCQDFEHYKSKGNR